MTNHISKFGQITQLQVTKIES